MKVRIKPKEGLKVRDPNSLKIIPSEGVEVELTPFYRRRLNDGSIEIVKPKKQKATIKEGE